MPGRMKKSACGQLGIPGRRQGPHGGLEALREAWGPPVFEGYVALESPSVVCPQVLSEPPALSSQIFLKVVEDCAVDTGPEGMPAGPCPDPSPRSRVRPDFRPSPHSWLTWPNLQP